jgi:hypothetical protein
MAETTDRWPPSQYEKRRSTQTGVVAELSPDFAEQARHQTTNDEIISQDTSTDCVSGRAVLSPVRSGPSGAVSGGWHSRRFWEADRLFERFSGNKVSMCA